MSGLADIITTMTNSCSERRVTSDWIDGTEVFTVSLHGRRIGKTWEAGGGGLNTGDPEVWPITVGMLGQPSPNPSQFTNREDAINALVAYGHQHPEQVFKE